MEIAFLILKCLDVVCTHMTVQINSNLESVCFTCALDSLLCLMFTFPFSYLYLGGRVRHTNAVALFTSAEQQHSGNYILDLFSIKIGSHSYSVVECIFMLGFCVRLAVALCM